MAILSSLPGISVTTHNAQGQFTEYPDAEPDAVKDLESPNVVVSKYIEAPPDGGPFWLKFSVEAPYIHSPNRVIFAFEDPVGGLIQMSCGRRDLKNQGLWEEEFHGYYDKDESASLFRNLQFSKLNILPADVESDDISETDKERMKKIGMLQVRVLLGKWTKIRAENSNETADDSAEYTALTANITTEKISERKSLSLGLIYNNEVVDASEVPEFAENYTYTSGWDSPIAIFQFKYRSRADLQKLLLIEMSSEPDHLPKEDLLPTLPTTPGLSSAPYPTPTSKFEDLTFAEVRVLTRKHYISFDKLSGDEMETLAKQTHAEQTVYANDELASLSFGYLTFAEVRNLAKKQYKSFDELNGDEIEGLARQGYSAAMVSSPAVKSEAPDDRNGQGKRKVSIKVEDGEEDVVFVSATKKRK